MSSFNLKIASPDGLKFSGKANKVIIRTINGDICVLDKHADFVSPLGKGTVKIVLENNQTKTAYSAGGLMSVRNGNVNVAPLRFEWK